MEIRALDMSSPAELHQYYLTMHSAEVAENPDRPIWTERAMTVHLVEPTPDEAVEAWVATNGDGTIVGGTLMFVPQLDNLDKVYTGLFVAPEHQRQGVGSALVEHLVGRAAAQGRTTVLTESGYAFDRREDHPHRRFAERHGFSVASIEVSRRLQLPVPEEQLQAWIDQAAPHHRDYRIETFESVPDELLPSVCDLSNQLAVDAPTGDIEFEAEGRTPEIRRQAEERDRRNGIVRRDTVAIAPNGEAVAVTTIGIQLDERDKVHQWVTIVHRDHRGHRLGLAVKAANLRAVQREFPDRTAIFTSNHEDNANMVAINEAMGFVPVELCVEFLRKLDG